MTPKVPNVKLSNGKEIPIIGLGTWKSKPDQVREAVKVAIDIGYRHLDCAFVYGNEAEIGEAIREKIADKTLKRKDLFITSKCWNSFHRREKVLEGCKMSLKNLGLDYLDLYLIHWPFTYEEGDNLSPKNGKGESLLADIDYVETWKGMEDCYKKGLVKSIGLSNFNSEQIKRVLENCTVKPVMLQIECHPYLNQDKLIEFCKERDIAVTAYSPLGSPDRPWGKSDEPCLLEDPRIKSIAEKHFKTPAQVLIRYQAQRGIVVIPKSVTPERIRSNFQIFDFILSSDEMSTIGSFKERFRYYAFERLKHVPNWPFNIEF